MPDIRDFGDWIREEPARAGPWLVLGKGPSFSRRLELDTSAFHVLSLNHVVREQRVHVAHMIDLDVAVDCADVLERNAEVVVLPWQPHRKNRPGRATLAHACAEVPVLARLAAAGRLLTYDLCTGRLRRGGGPLVQATYFSAEAALSLLALNGVAVARSLGVDGGRTYDGRFQDLRDRTLLNNGHQSFDLQFRGIARTIMTTGIDFAPLDEESPVRVYVGSQDAQMLAVKVLEYSIRKHASMSVEVHPLHEAGADITVPMPRAVENRPRTPFSFQRFFIPQLAGYRGRAIYVDSDMQVFKDIRALWTIPFDGADLLAAREAGEHGRRPQFSVMLLDCAALRWNIEEIVAKLDRGELNYQTLMYEMRVASRVEAAIDPRWNSLERYEEGETALLHYTDMDTQPWISRANKLGYLWMRDLSAAVKDGFISREYVEDHVRRGWVRPSVLFQLDNDVEDPLLLPKAAVALDANFVPPYRTMGSHGGGKLSPLHVLRAVLRRVAERTGLQRVRRGLRRPPSH